MKIINEEGALVIKSWCEQPEEGAIKQAMNLARLPFAFRQICLMPDTHQGYGMPIGGVMATQGVIVPNAVGADIGCGMCAVKTSLQEINVEDLKKIMGEIRRVVPLGMNRHKEKQAETLMPVQRIIGVDYYQDYPICSREYEKALYQVGTLGGGNHFIEIQKGSDGHIWIMIHSGSRNIGKQVADHYNKVAVEINEKYFSVVPKDWELAFLPMDSDEGQLYLNEIQYCVDFALANRKLMMDRILQIIADIVDGVEQYGQVNIAHNYAVTEHHFGKYVLIHRKGATSARGDEIGIIPGSQGTSSYIVRGKGNPESFMSCSHGAGRKMGRKQAQRELSLEEEKRKMDERGILHAIRGKNDLDEASGAYKPIDVVMQEQADLVDILVKLEPLAVIKG